MKIEGWIELAKLGIPSITSLITLYFGIKIKQHVHKIHLEINSKMDLFIKEVKKSSFAAGKLEGKRRK